jgi:hypothetical protein
MRFVPGWRWFPDLSREFGTSTRETLELQEGENPEPKLGEFTLCRLQTCSGYLMISTELILKWNEKVKKMVPPEKLLIMDIKDGWEPLCRFLELPIPDEPFPRANDSSAAAQAAVDISNRLHRISVGIISTSVAVAAIVAWKLIRSR